MDRRTFLKTLPAFAAMAGTSSGLAGDPPAPAPAPAQGLPPIALPRPEADGGKSVLAALKERRTNRSIRADRLPPQVLSNLLWAAWGVNREAGATGRPGRTAASASNSQEIDLYVALEEGIYLYESYYDIATGLIAGNVYLFAASQGLAAWFHNCDKESLARELKLRPDQRVLYGQTVGYPA